MHKNTETLTFNQQTESVVLTNTLKKIMCQTAKCAFCSYLRKCVSNGKSSIA